MLHFERRLSGAQNSWVGQPRGTSPYTCLVSMLVCLSPFWIIPTLNIYTLGSRVSVCGLLSTNLSPLAAPIFVLLLTTMRLCKSLLCCLVAVLMLLASWAEKPNWPTLQGRNWWWGLASLLFILLLSGVLAPWVLWASAVPMLLCCPLCFCDTAQNSEGHCDSPASPGLSPCSGIMQDRGNKQHAEGFLSCQVSVLRSFVPWNTSNRWKNILSCLFSYAQ